MLHYELLRACLAVRCMHAAPCMHGASRRRSEHHRAVVVATSSVQLRVAFHLHGSAAVPVCSAPRLRGACSMYVLQNSAVAASAGAALVLFYTGILHGIRFWLLVCRCPASTEGVTVSERLGAAQGLHMRVAPSSCCAV